LKQAQCRQVQKDFTVHRTLLIMQRRGGIVNLPREIFARGAEFLLLITLPTLVALIKWMIISAHRKQYFCCSESNVSPDQIDFVPRYYVGNYRSILYYYWSLVHLLKSKSQQKNPSIVHFCQSNI